MKFRPTSSRGCCAKPCTRGFTLVEVLASLVFMAIVIPTAVQGLRVASLAGEVGQRKAVAARIGDRVLNEMIVMRQWQNSAAGGVIQEGPVQYRWRVQTEPWNQQTSRSPLAGH